MFFAPMILDSYCFALRIRIRIYEFWELISMFMGRRLANPDPKPCIFFGSGSGLSVLV